MTDKETQQTDIQKRLEQLHDKLRALNLPIAAAAYPPGKDNQATGTTDNQTATDNGQTG